MLIYEGSALTLSVSMMLIMTFIMRHSMTGAGVLDLMTLPEAHMLAPNLCKTSMKLIWQFFSRMRHKSVCHHYCTYCYSYIGLSNDQDFPLYKGKSSRYLIIKPILT